MIYPRGLSAFPITPMNSDGQVDVAGLRKLVARLVKAQVDCIGLLGSTGSYAYLSGKERRRALEAAQDQVAGTIPIIVGVGALRTDDAVQFARDAKAAGATAGLLAPVSYTPLTDEEVFEHFAVVAGESGLPICIYNNPGTTHFTFSTELVTRLSRVPGIVAIKNPAGNAGETAAQLRLLRDTVPAHFSLGCSVDWHAADALIAGADVWYSVLGGLFPHICKRILIAVRDGDSALVRRLDAYLAPLWDLFREFSSLRVIYALASLCGIMDAAPPRPIRPLAPSVQDKVAYVFENLPEEVAL